MRAPAVMRHIVHSWIRATRLRCFGTLFVIVVCAYLGALLAGLTHIRPVAEWIDQRALMLEPMLPATQLSVEALAGRPPHGPSTLTGVRTTGESKTRWTGLVWHVATRDAPGRGVLLVLLHLGVCTLAVPTFFRYGFPTVRGSFSSSTSAIVMRTAFRSAIAALPLPALVALLHRVWWTLAYAPLLHGEGPMRGLAVGQTGIAGMRAGSALAYLLIVGHAARRTIQSELDTDLVCPRCGYSRSNDAPCSECGSSSQPMTRRHMFALGRGLTHMKTRHPRLIPMIGICLVLILLNTPLVLGVLGSVLPQHISDGIVRAWIQILSALS